MITRGKSRAGPLLVERVAVLLLHPFVAVFVAEIALVTVRTVLAILASSAGGSFGSGGVSRQSATSRWKCP